MLITIDTASAEPLYQQIRNQIIAGIATGELEPGTSLPSVRALASDLGINLHTVNRAYAMLRDEGFVRMRGRAGAVIAHPSDADRADKSARALVEMEDDLFKIALSFRACGGTRGEFLERAAVQAARAYGVMPEETSRAPEAASEKSASKTVQKAARKVRSSLPAAKNRSAPKKA